jgi:hypothetical protein
MVRRAVCGVWALAVVCVGGVPRAASATSGGAYDVPRECPARAEWLQALRVRLPPLLRTHPLVEAQRVHIERVDGAAGTEYEGSLASAGEAGSADPRPVVRGATCAELIDVLSFMGALGLERVAAAPAPTKAASHESLSLLSVEALPSAGADRAASVGDAENASAFRAGATAFALLQTGIAPGRSLDFGVGGRLEWSLPGWQPLVLLGVLLRARQRGQRRRLGQGALRTLVHAGGGLRVAFSEPRNSRVPPVCRFRCGNDARRGLRRGRCRGTFRSLGERRRAAPVRAGAVGPHRARHSTGGDQAPLPRPILHQTELDRL